MGKFWLACLLPLLLSAAPSAFSASDDDYDYIVVGSGPGGGTLAYQLAKAGASVLLLEAGDDQGENPIEKVAGLFPLAKDVPEMRWDFFVKYSSDDAVNAKYSYLTWKTTDGQFYVGLDPPAGATQLGVYYPRTGTLGGCATHNAMCSVLPSNSDWEEIVEITGDKSWSPENMRRHFMNLETAHNVPANSSGHGYEGFLDITINTDEWARNLTDSVDVFKSSAKLLGQDPDKIYEYLTADLNNNHPDRDQETGIWGFPAHRDPKGNRVSTRDAVLELLEAKKPDGSPMYNLTVSYHSLATKVLFNTEGEVPRAIGVEYLEGKSMYAADPRYDPNSEGVVKQAFARGEVIVSGGTFNSPQILKLSGIGPKEELAKFDIPVIVDLPGVGANLQDNPEFGYIAHAAKALINKSPACTFGAPGDPCLAAWEEGKGPYATGPLGALMYKTKHAEERDIFYFFPQGVSFQGYWPGQTVNQIPMDPPSVFDFSIVHFENAGKLGTVTLTSGNPRDVPEINFRFFEDGSEEVLDAIVEAVEFARNVTGGMTGPLTPWTERFPCPAENPDCDVKETIKLQAWSHHATSTCMIGADDDVMAVLDSKFRVRGVDGLRVVDASSFPKPPGAFPVIPVFMLGMKAAESILEDSM